MQRHHILEPWPYQHVCRIGVALQCWHSSSLQFQCQLCVDSDTQQETHCIIAVFDIGFCKVLQHVLMMSLILYVLVFTMPTFSVGSKMNWNMSLAVSAAVLGSLEKNS